MDIVWQLQQVTLGLSGAAAALLAASLIVLVGKAVGAVVQHFQPGAVAARGPWSIWRLMVASAWVVGFTAVSLAAALTLTALIALLATATAIVLIEYWSRTRADSADVEVKL
jgi:hypothetical protein